jgi:hypothetical protein
MKQRCRPVKFLLRRFVARCGKVHRAQFFAVQMLLLLRQGARVQQGKKDKRNGLLLWPSVTPVSSSITAVEAGLRKMVVRCRERRNPAEGYR